MSKLILWCVTDNKPGHKSQLDGLASALGEITSVDIYWINCQQPFTKSLSKHGPSPDLILAAGHRTHLTALLLKYRFGGMVAVLMKPSLPRWLFDLCIIPEHDRVKESSNIITTKGALNTVRPSSTLEDNKGLILIGGPSKHHGWSALQMLSQLQSLKAELPKIHWTLTTSRRTPNDFYESIQSLEDHHFSIVPVNKTDKTWLNKHYAQSGVIWVTEDSVSMIYESLSSGARVGLLSVPRKTESRVSKGIDQLLAKEMILNLEQLMSKGMMPSNQTKFCEAHRVAAHIANTLTQKAI